MPNPDAPACDCRWFDRAAKNPDIPITFDERMNEFHLMQIDGNGHSSLYHCPFCGGRAPESLRKTFFRTVSHDESARLHLHTKEIKTEDELIALLGPPDTEYEIGGGMTKPGSEIEPDETFVNGRRLVYRNLSETADVNVRIDRYGQLRFSYTGKYLGDMPSSPSTQTPSLEKNTHQ